MSANNFILIDRKSLEVSLRDADTNALLVKIGKAKTLEEAIDLAQEYQEREIVEYGIHFTGKVNKNKTYGTKQT
jgi:hypothetical protein